MVRSRSMAEPHAEPRLLRAGAAILSLALLAALGAFAWRGWYTRYLTDDYCTAAALHQHGYAGAMAYQRAQWSGRYAYYAVKGALESIGPQTAHATPGLMIALTLLAAFWLMRPLMPSRWLAFASACAVAFAVVDSAPGKFDMYGAVMWETGAITYMLPVVLWIVWLGFIVRGSGAFASFFVMFVAGGLSETSLATQGVLVAGTLLIAALRRDRNRTRLAIIGVIATIIAFALVLSAPGNAIRAEGAPPPGSIGVAVLSALGLAYRFIGSHLFPEGASLLVVAAVATHAGKARRIWLSIAAIAVVGAIVAIVPSTWLISQAPPPRALYIVNVCAIAAMFGLFGATRYKAAGALLIVLSIVPVLSAIDTVRTIPEARAAARHIDAITQTLATQRGRDVVLHSRWALESRYLDNDPNHWANACACRYFGLRSLRIVRQPLPATSNRRQP